MRNDFYPIGTVHELLKTELVTDNTRKVLTDRLLGELISSPKFFNSKQFETLTAACMRIIPQPNREHPVDLPGLLEEQFIQKTGNGWRYASMPDDSESVMSGIDGIEETAMLSFNSSFHLLDILQQDSILFSLQSGTATGGTWEHLSAPLFFEELLTRLVEIYYSHPLAKEEIGDTSFADAKGWKDIGLNQTEDYESKIKKVGS